MLEIVGNVSPKVICSNAAMFAVELFQFLLAIYDAAITAQMQLIHSYFASEKMISAFVSQENSHD